MEEAMSHTGIHQFLFLFSGFFFNTCMGPIASFPLIHPSMELLALNLWLHAGDTLTTHNQRVVFLLIEAHSCVATPNNHSEHMADIVCCIFSQLCLRVKHLKQLPPPP